MQAMQYTVTLPTDYDMQIIRKRVADNGNKTDYFSGLLFKAYFITEREQGSVSNSYAPLYIWKDSEGMNKFIFKGFYDNIIQSFGWQHIEIGVTSSVDLAPDFLESRYAIEEYQPIAANTSLQDVPLVAERHEGELGKVRLYNPDKWQLVTYTFLHELPDTLSEKQKSYEILHISPGLDLK